ncbi:hypothetical protein BABINDRAFT_162499 [Babjeviella inositovora NRRL Y-12698]|uniref:Uncharacterized protein n=1 Tax=Babjeviella inositovora NRRL Y-12698 TaxID=984486 RepID=A0A1E3QPA8_9ASCO|nr:uncharacterized protein BABINDRAFT_162499 [Babjeviella inositovora NRRL Y-12698]ODQ78817.1 hypothetical protein BABINDRAFT_162499 [Babjeviella inositovora NRRL Y-12698]
MDHDFLFEQAEHEGLFDVGTSETLSGSSDVINAFHKAFSESMLGNHAELSQANAFEAKTGAMEFQEGTENLEAFHEALAREIADEISHSVEASQLEAVEFQEASQPEAIEFQSGFSTGQELETRTENTMESQGYAGSQFMGGMSHTQLMQEHTENEAMGVPEVSQRDDLPVIEETKETIRIGESKATAISKSESENNLQYENESVAESQPETSPNEAARSLPDIAQPTETVETTIQDTIPKALSDVTETPNSQTESGKTKAAVPGVLAVTSQADAPKIGEVESLNDQIVETIALAQVTERPVLVEETDRESLSMEGEASIQEASDISTQPEVPTGSVAAQLEIPVESVAVTHPAVAEIVAHEPQDVIMEEANNTHEVPDVKQEIETRPLSIGEPAAMDILQELPTEVTAVVEIPEASEVRADVSEAAGEVTVAVTTNTTADLPVTSIDDPSTITVEPNDHPQPTEGALATNDGDSPHEPGVSQKIDEPARADQTSGIPPNPPVMTDESALNTSSSPPTTNLFESEDHRKELYGFNYVADESQKEPKPNEDSLLGMSENEQLHYIASHLELATQANKKDNYLSFIPAHSELLTNKDNAALSAYSTLTQTETYLSVTSLSSQLAALPLTLLAPTVLPSRMQLLINSIPALDNLATQILRIVAINPYGKVLEFVRKKDELLDGINFRDLIDCFEYTKRQYGGEETPFLTVENVCPGLWQSGGVAPAFLRGKEEVIESCLRKANLATFLGATLGMIEVGFFWLNEFFLDVFCPASTFGIHGPVQAYSASNGVGRFLKPQAGLFLELKTQAYISAVSDNDREETDGDRSREEILDDIFAPDLDKLLVERRGAKLLTPAEQDFLERCASRRENLLLSPPGEDLAERYEWVLFLKELFEYVGKNIGSLVWGRKGRHFNATPSVAIRDGWWSKTTLEPSPPAAASKSRAEETPPEFTESMDYQSLFSSTAQPSKIKHLARRPWSKEEQDALREALELKGPHWAQILELFGAGGKISEALKNRTQVQLKDKARNWKMFYLKTGKEVPFYLQQVTGDLDRDDKLKLTNKNKVRNTYT